MDADRAIRVRNLEGFLLDELLVARGMKATVAMRKGPDGEEWPVWDLVPTMTRYTLAVDTAQDLNALDKVLRDGKHIINQTRERNGLLIFDPITGDAKDTRLRFDRGTLRVEVNRLDPEILTWSEAMSMISIPKSEHVLALAGVEYQTNDVRPVFWVPTDDSQSHAVVVGTTGSGKTNLLISMMASVMLSTPPSELAIHIGDLKRSRSLRQLAQAPHVVDYGMEPEQVYAMLLDLHEEMERRERSDEAPTLRRILFLDEIASLMDGVLPKAQEQEAAAVLKEIMRKSRESKINVVIGTQKATAQTVGDSSITANIQVRFCGAVPTTDEAYHALKVRGSGANELPGNGAFMLSKSGRIRTFQSPLMDVGSLLQGLSRVERVYPMRDRSEDAPVSVATGVRVPPAEEFYQLDKVVQDALIIGEMLHSDPSKADMCRWIRHDQPESMVNTGGATRRRVESALAYLEDDGWMPDEVEIPESVYTVLAERGWYFQDAATPDEYEDYGEDEVADGGSDYLPERNAPVATTTTPVPGLGHMGLNGGNSGAYEGSSSGAYGVSY